MAFAELKARQSVIWGNGPYERITNTIRDIHALVIERSDPKPGERVLDAATGTGAVAIIAAKRGAEVIGQDLAPVLIDTARERAAEEDVTVQFEVGDAEDMRYDDASFDVVMSTCGVMFAPDHEAVARELARVTKPGGRLALACWTPEAGHGAGVQDDGGRSCHRLRRARAVPFAWGDGGSRAGAARRGVRARVRGARLVRRHRRSGEDVLGAVLHVLRADEDRRRGTRRRAPRGVPSSLGRLLRARREGDQVVHHREYLLTLGTRR